MEGAVADLHDRRERDRPIDGRQQIFAIGLGLGREFCARRRDRSTLKVSANRERKSQ